MDISKFHNPYDFANPVSDENLFVGRKSELEEIRYYLDHAKRAPRPINLAILGDRASGKTSLLNMCAIESKKKGFCVVRIELDEGDAQSQLSFFQKIFDGLIASACDQGAFGGKKGKTYDVYLDMMNAYVVPEDKTFCPFLFPLQYAKAMAAGNASAQISDHNFKADLVCFREELKTPAVLLFDECNVLAKSSIHLEKLRNIFMNTPGFMLVFTGTTDLFPIMDDVFSPIVRQFKKINVAGFKDEKETGECIRKPLERNDIKPEEIFDFETLHDVSEIHDLSGGKPYEIQLICHKLFQRVQWKQAKRMKLNLGVLEDVRKELETSQDITARPILTKLKKLSPDELKVLKLLCSCNARATIDQLWDLEYAFRGAKYFTKDSVKKKLGEFLKDEILIDENGILRFAGDDFDKVYAKYFAREQKISLRIDNVSPEAFWIFRFISAMRNIGMNVQIGSTVGLDRDFNLADLIGNIQSRAGGEDFSKSDMRIFENLYYEIFNSEQESDLPIIRFRVDLPWLKVQSWFELDKKAESKSFEKAVSETNAIGLRIKELGGTFTTELVKVSAISSEILSDRVLGSGNVLLMKELADWHLMCMHDLYVEKKRELALLHAMFAYKYDREPSPVMCNNLGYVFLTEGVYDKSRVMLEKAITSYDELRALPTYNLAMLEIKCNNLESALSGLTRCASEADSLSKEKRKCACVLFPKLENDGLSLQEIWEPDLFDAANEAIAIITDFRSRQKSG